MCISVQAIAFEWLHIETSFLVYRYIFTISRSGFSNKVIGQGQGHTRKNYNLLYFNMFILCMLLKVINRPRSDSKVKVKVKSKVKVIREK